MRLTLIFFVTVWASSSSAMDYQQCQMLMSEAIKIEAETNNITSSHMNQLMQPNIYAEASEAANAITDIRNINKRLWGEYIDALSEYCRKMR
ncbi:hypothetical protein CEW89_08405 [Celeribacter ethanolicus]|uniref:Uncharacterized protein n=1 Tax=Celeribacter ethanolicus TaxID=1758178 RepID=A0A291GC13_9RHOB|nr:hypothetical protein [Celeribacter ethanolicus]ATG47594.1 hypothetical protein CEW89_08405 [Celeribacter ethanolicus]